MDSAFLAQNFATLVGLLCNFRQERGSEKTSSHQEFIEWLAYHKHEELKNLIVNDSHVAREVDALLQKNQEAILQQIKELNQALATVLTRVVDFSGLADVLVPGVGLSEQAKGFLTKFADSDFRFMNFWPQLGTLKLANGFNDFGELLKPIEPRFVEDDLKTLARMGALEIEHTGDCLSFKLTRTGAALARARKPSQ